MARLDDHPESGGNDATEAQKVDVVPDKPSRAERLIAAGDKMQKAGDATTKAGCGVTGFVFSLIALIVIIAIVWAVAC